MPIMIQVTAQGGNRLATFTLEDGFADRPAAYRYLFDREVTGIPGVYDQLIAMVAGPNRPLYVIGSQRGNSFPDHGLRFWRAVAAHYHLETTIGDVPIYRANDSP